MTGVLGLLAVLAALGVVVTALWWFATIARKRTIGTSLLTVVDELYHPIAYEGRSATTVSDQRTGPSRLPGAPPPRDDTDAPGDPDAPDVPGDFGDPDNFGDPGDINRR